MRDGGDGFVGRCEVVEPRRGNRRWPLDLTVRIVAESFQPGVRVVDVARRHGVVAHQLSDWRGQAWECLLILPLNMLPALSVQKEGRGEPAFVPVAVLPELEVALVTQASALSVPEAEVPVGIMTVELVCCGVVRVPGDVAVERAAALVRALQDKR
jgi:transposase